ncbi:MAG TPA: SpoIIE family protein phosphatase [Rectinemataceae bacterium]|nr:SpoIIE family protein phosphatase [Rectinemataceae bacterium]
MDAGEELGSALSGGLFLHCDGKGRRLFSDPAALAQFLGVTPESVAEDFGAVLGKDAPRAYSEFFAKVENDISSLLLPYRHPGKALRWLALRRARDPGNAEGFLVFLRDETVFRESMLKLTAAQSRDVENSARLQAAVLMEGARHDIPGLDYKTATIPSKLVDGDFLDVLRLSEDSVDFLLGDVMGKGMDAAIVGAMIKFGFVRALSSSLFAAPRLPDPAAICRAVDEALVRRLLERQSFATLTYARFEEETHAVRFVDCGHTSIIHFSRRTGECWQVKGGNMPLGFMEGQTYRSFLLPIESGDCLLLYTDGLSECYNRYGEAFGEERVARVLKTYADLSAAELSGTLLKIGFAYSAAGFNDDVSLICIKDRSDPAAGEMGRVFALELGSTVPEAPEGAVELLGSDLDAWVPELSIDTRSEILLALQEALVNIVEHGLSGSEGSCDIAWRLRGGLFSAEIAYSGPEYDWSRKPHSPLAEFAESGYGLFILDNAMDSYLVCKGFDDRKRLVMCREIAGDRIKGENA